MEMKGEQMIAAPRETVWAALNDPEILRQCIPGCQSINKLSDTELEAEVLAKVGPVSAKFKGKVKISDLDPPNGYTISGEGQGGVAGFGKGGAKVALAEAGPNATLLSYTATAQVGGKLAQIGSRLVDSAAAKMADDFFTKFKDVVGGPAIEPVAAAPDVAVEAAPAPAAPAPAAAASAPAATPGKGLPPAVWVTGLVAAVVIVLVVLLNR